MFIRKKKYLELEEKLRKTKLANRETEVIKALISSGVAILVGSLISTLIKPSKIAIKKDLNDVVKREYEKIFKKEKEAMMRLLITQKKIYNSLQKDNLTALERQKKLDEINIIKNDISDKKNKMGDDSNYIFEL